MLNYIWAGLIIISLVFAVAYDVRDAANDTYRNQQELPLALAFPEGYSDARRVPVAIRIDPTTYGRFYGTEARPDSIYQGTLIQTQQGRMLRFAAEASLPEPMAT